MKIIAAKEGLLMAWEMEFQSIILEGDAKEVFKNFNSSSTDLSHSSVILHDTTIVSLWFDYFSAIFVQSEYSSVTDCLADLARNEDQQVWSGTILDCIVNLLNFDYEFE